MKGLPEIITLLNEILLGELTAINQYFLHAKMCKHWGYDRLHEKIYKESIDEMKHASLLADRILFLDGLPNFQKLGKLRIGENVLEMFNADLGLEDEAIPRLRAGIKLCYEAADHGTRDLLEKILVSEEEHADWLETQLHIIKDIGMEHYLAQHIRTTS